VFENWSKIFQDTSTIKNILCNCQFWQHIKQLKIILISVKRVIQLVKAKLSNMVSCFLELVKIAIA
ncbi:30074_t:CDS:1, partial [Gigaspora margarita]